MTTQIEINKKALELINIFGSKEIAIKATIELRQFRYIKFINQKWKKKCLLEQKPYIKHYAVH